MHSSQEQRPLPREPERARDDRRRALVVLDRPVLSGLIELTLNHGQFVVRTATDLVGAENVLAEWAPDLAVIDVENDDSTELLERLGAARRMHRSVTPILGLTRRGDLQTKLRAFELGVDDILTVPFSPEELLARAIVITRRSTGVARAIVPTIRLGTIEVDIVHREVRVDSLVVHLSEIEQSLLYLLASRNGQTVSRDEILDAIWGPDFVSESNIVDRHVWNLRAKLHDDYRKPRFIATVTGAGYRFVPTFTKAGWRPQPRTGAR